MNFIVESLTENYAKQICNWKYKSEYSIYNYPKWDKIFSENWGITIDQTRKKEFSAIVDECTNLCGYIRILDKNEHLLIGLGLKPSLCGKGLGIILMELLIQECKKGYGNKKIVLEVRSFNERAIRCYKNADFKVVDTCKKETPMGYGEFIKMEFTD